MATKAKNMQSTSPAALNAGNVVAMRALPVDARKRMVQEDYTDYKSGLNKTRNATQHTAFILMMFAEKNDLTDSRGEKINVMAIISQSKSREAPKRDAVIAAIFSKPERVDSEDVTEKDVERGQDYRDRSQFIVKSLALASRMYANGLRSTDFSEKSKTFLVPALKFLKKDEKIVGIDANDKIPLNGQIIPFSNKNGMPAARRATVEEFMRSTAQGGQTTAPRVINVNAKVLDAVTTSINKGDFNADKANKDTRDAFNTMIAALVTHYRTEILAAIKERNTDDQRQEEEKEKKAAKRPGRKAS